MSCESLINFLTDYLDGRLPFGQRAALQIHLILCRECRDYLHNFQATIRACRAARQPFGVASLTAEQTEDLMRLFRDVPR